MRTIGKALVLAMAVSGIAVLSVAQTEQKPAFEVASIKPTSIPPRPIPGSGQTFMAPINLAGGRLLIRSTTLRALTQFAYGKASASPLAAVHTVVGGPDFIDNARYDVEARTESGVPSELVRAMMRSLLEERFGLVVHAEMRELPVYHLVIGKGGLKMKQLPADAPVRLRSDSSTRTVSFVLPMSSIVGSAQGWADRLVIDKTGLTGMFEEALRDGLSAGSEAGARIQADVRARFEDGTGLRLVPAKETVEVLVIDHAEKPSDN